MEAPQRQQIKPMRLVLMSTQFRYLLSQTTVNCETNKRVSTECMFLWQIFGGVILYASARKHTASGRADVLAQSPSNVLIT